MTELRGAAWSRAKGAHVHREQHARTWLDCLPSSSLARSLPDAAEAGSNSTPLAGASFTPSVVEFETGQCIVRDYRWEYQRAGERVISRDRHVTTSAIGGCSIAINVGQFLTNRPKALHRYRILAQRHHRRSDPCNRFRQRSKSRPDLRSPRSSRSVPVIQMINFLGAVTTNNPAITYTVNSLSAGTTPELYDFSWSQLGPGLDVPLRKRYPKTFRIKQHSHEPRARSVHHLGNESVDLPVYTLHRVAARCVLPKH